MRPVPTLVLLLAAWPALAQGNDNAVVEITGHIVEPARLEPTDERIAGLAVPDGFQVARFAEGLEKPRMIAVADDGRVYVTRRESNDVLMLRDGDGDGISDQAQVVANLPQVHGIAIHGRRIWLATVNDVYAGDLAQDGTVSGLERIINDLPDGGQHPNRTLGLGPDGMLYISVGSTCNACAETNPESATILRATPDGKFRTILASGLRNTIGFGWQPDDGRLWGFDHGIDWLGDEEQPEELNLIEGGKRYGWPYIYADGQANPQDEPPGGISMDTWRAMSTPPVLTYTAHAAPMQMVFYTGGAFPAEYRGDAFIAMRGSWNRKDPSGYEVVRVDFDGGKPVRIEPFLTGFLLQGAQGPARFGRPVGMAQMPDGSLLVGDDDGGVIYRISHASAEGGPAAAADAQPDPSAGALPSGQDPAPPADTTQRATVAIKAEGLAGDGALQVTSPSLSEGAAIPNRYTAYDDGISPALRWSGGPEGTKSYVLLMEDPDVPLPAPFAHWVMYNIPPDVTALPEAVPSAERVPSLGGALQGATTAGSSGYFGPKPPPGPAHHYHFQLFALDRMLDLKPGASAAEVRQAMQGHVLASGVFVATHGR